MLKAWIQLFIVSKRNPQGKILYVLFFSLFTNVGSVSDRTLRSFWNFDCRLLGRIPETRIFLFYTTFGQNSEIFIYKTYIITKFHLFCGFFFNWNSIWKKCHLTNIMFKILYRDPETRYILIFTNCVAQPGLPPWSLTHWI